MNKNLELFLIGSSPFLILPFYIVVYFINEKKYSYFNYTLICPIYFGISNVISYNFFKFFNIKNRFLLTSIISFFSSLLFVKIFDMYEFDNNKWNKYYILLLFGHLIAWNIIIYNLEKILL